MTKPLAITFTNSQGHKLYRNLEPCEVAPGVTIFPLIVLGDVALCEFTGKELAERLSDKVQALIMPDGKGQALLHVMGRESKHHLPTYVARKEHKVYMGKVISGSGKSITSDRVQTFYLSEDDANALRGLRVAIVDDVVSTGATIEAVKDILAQIGATVVAILAVATEGEARPDVIALTHLPVLLG